MLFVALAGLELAFDLLAIEAVAPLLTASPAVEHWIRGDLIPVAVLAGRQAAGEKRGSSTPALAGRTPALAISSRGRRQSGS